MEVAHELFRALTCAYVRRLAMLADGEDVAVRIFEPGYFVAAGGGPDSEFLILDEGIFFGGDALLLEPGDDGFDVCYFPAEDSALQRSEI